MQILFPYTNPPDVPVVITMGMFDGVHLGHQNLLEHTRTLASRLGARSAVYTMRNHPAHTWGAVPPPMLMTAGEKCAKIRALGIDDIYAVHFSREMAMLSPKAFVEALCAALDVRAVVVGFDFTFGRGGEGNMHTLRELGGAYGFGAEVIKPVLEGGEKVSSQRIRNRLALGDAEGAARLLGTAYTLRGTVRSCRGLGSKLGFPTANMDLERGKLLPQNGVYITRVHVMGRDFEGMTNIGERPTVQGSGSTSIETHILGFRHNCVGERLKVDFLRKIRDEIHFPSLEVLRGQLESDLETTRRYFAQQPAGV